MYRGIEEDDDHYDDFHITQALGFDYIKDRFTYNHNEKNIYIVNVMQILGPNLQEIMDHFEEKGFYVNPEFGKIISI